MLVSKLRKEPEFLLGEVRLRARNMEPVVLELMTGFVLTLGGDDDEWTFRQHMNGGNSFSLRNSDDGREFHFRYYHSGRIHVYNSWQHGKLVAKLASRKDARTFVKSLVQ
jgi:hypothetical protein